MTGRRISPLTAAALCVKSRGEMKPHQIVNVDVRKAASGEFATMRGLAMRFAGLLQGSDVRTPDVWLRDPCARPSASSLLQSPVFNCPQLRGRPFL
jgi:hypothetical protein